MDFRLVTRLRGCGGQSVVEFALILPLLVGFVMGVVDLSRALHAHNAIVNMSREGANLAARSSVMLEKDGPQLVMNSLADSETSLTMKTRGMMYLTEVVLDDEGNKTMKEQYVWAQNASGPRSAVDKGSLPDVLGDITIRPGEEVWIFEVFYDYDSLFLPSSRGRVSQLHSIAIL